MFLLIFQCKCCVPSLFSTPSVPTATEYGPNVPSVAEHSMRPDVLIASRLTCKVRIICAYVHIVPPHLSTPPSTFLSMFLLMFLQTFLSMFVSTTPSRFLSTILLTFPSTSIDVSIDVSIDISIDVSINVSINVHLS